MVIQFNLPRTVVWKEHCTSTSFEAHSTAGNKVQINFVLAVFQYVEVFDIVQKMLQSLVVSQQGITINLCKEITKFFVRENMLLRFRQGNLNASRLKHKRYPVQQLFRHSMVESGEREFIFCKSFRLFFWNAVPWRSPYHRSSRNWCWRSGRTWECRRGVVFARACWTRARPSSPRTPLPPSRRSDCHPGVRKQNMAQ